MERPFVLVLGSGDVASAVAHAFFIAGFPTAIQDHASPATLRRGMAFSDAAFTGKATLEAVVAARCEPGDALREMLARGESLPFVVGDAIEVAGRLRPALLVDARMRKRVPAERLMGLARFTLGVGPGFECGMHVDRVVESQWGPQLGRVLSAGHAAPLEGEPRIVGGAGRERFVYAPARGVFRTDASIGARVRSGARVGTLDGEAVPAPMSGALRGLVHDGVRVDAGMKLVEIDADDAPLCFGLGERPLAIATGILRECRTFPREGAPLP